MSSSHWVPDLGFFFFSASKMVRRAAVEEALVREVHDWFHLWGSEGTFGSLFWAIPRRQLDLEL